MNLDACNFDLVKVASWASAIGGIAYILFLIWRINRTDNDFRVIDLVLEGNPAKASISKLILIIFASLSVWVVILSVLENKIDPAVSALLLGVLGIFVLGRTAQQGIASLASRPQTEAPPHGEAEEEDRPPAKPRRGSVIR